MKIYRFLRSAVACLALVCVSVLSVPALASISSPSFDVGEIYSPKHSDADRVDVSIRPIGFDGFVEALLRDDDLIAASNDYKDTSSLFDIAGLRVANKASMAALKRVNSRNQDRFYAVTFKVIS